MPAYTLKDFLEMFFPGATVIVFGLLLMYIFRYIPRHKKDEKRVEEIET
jgi:hypothetical protein